MGSTQKKTIVSHTGNLDFRLRMIDETDIEDLRKWKNLNKGSFFLKSDITIEQQRAWYAGFRDRVDDFMFVVEQFTGGRWEKIGCMGFRVLTEEGCVDAYNIIRSRRIKPASFAMSEPFQMMLTYACKRYRDVPIRCKVLVENPAVAWYEKNGFNKIEEIEGYYLMELDQDSIPNLNLIVT
jgi:hypothetical protein